MSYDQRYAHLMCDDMLKKKIYISSLGQDVTESDLRAHFSKFGKVRMAYIRVDNETQVSREFGFVDFETVEASLAAQKQKVAWLTKQTYLITC